VSDSKTPSPIPRRLKEARLKSGLSQKALGLEAGMDEFSASSRMNHYEQGLHSPDYHTLEKIGRRLNVPTAFFYIEDDDMAKLVVKYHGLTKTQKRAVSKFVEEL